MADVPSGLGLTPPQETKKEVWRYSYRRRGREDVDGEYNVSMVHWVTLAVLQTMHCRPLLLPHTWERGSRWYIEWRWQYCRRCTFEQEDASWIMNWKVFERKRWWPDLSCCDHICLEGVRVTLKILSKDNRFPRRRRISANSVIIFSRLSSNFLTYTLTAIVKSERFLWAGLVALRENEQTERKTLGKRWLPIPKQRPRHSWSG
jgi:hypothetical protein